ncbi:riboflavin synthase subunit alpha [Algimonas arctica]|uniref:Riboflavin synthase n=1 Tax=Algimonas arctica TaxID=1479486 RepID=A0A8J3CPX6_9PROT|nr:riboflavin synthase [Algimonas arctica]GHA83742.1 riboflavin synthase subunit alpha [Algimonas arctica]
MFTGIITDVGRLREVTRVTGSEWGDTRMIVETAFDTDTINIGASIAHSGACMTVVDKGRDKDQNWYAFDVSDESLDKTTLGDWAVGQAINLERALTGTDELGGHMVTGHVDTTARCVSRDAVAGSTRYRIKVPEDLAFAIAPKGSVTVDGVSLTVNDVSAGTFMINIIPHTLEVTTLGRLQPGDEVNLEIDVIARYVARYLSHMKA